MAERTVKLGSFAPGVNNRLGPTELDTKLPDGANATFLYGGVNIDITAKGRVHRRRGKTVVDPAPMHSLWSDAQGAYVAFDNTLWRLRMSADGLEPSYTLLHAGVNNSPVSYSRGADGDVYWSDGATIRRATPSDASLRVAAQPPAVVPGVAAGAGALPAGRYLIAFTRQDENGESAATRVQSLTLGENGGISITSAEAVNVYVSAPNGDVPTLQAAGVTADTIVTHVDNRRRCPTLNLATMPPGQIVRHYNGRLLVAAGRILYISEPYNYGLYNPSRGYVPLPAHIAVVRPVDGGVYICADKTYWITDFFGGELQEVLPYGGLLGSDRTSPDDQTVHWQSPHGLIVADKAGSVKNLQEAALEFGDATAGATLYRKQNGMTRLVTSRAGAALPTAAASSYMEARVIQKGTDL